MILPTWLIDGIPPTKQITYITSLPKIPTILKEYDDD
jgi:hypothetical protein